MCGVTDRELNHFNKMSWQQYVDDQLIGTKIIDEACLAGHDGVIWATSPGLGVSIRVAPFLPHRPFACIKCVAGCIWCIIFPLTSLGIAQYCQMTTTYKLSLKLVFRLG